MNTATATATLPTYAAQHENRFGPARIEHRTAESGFTLLGTYVMQYDQDGHSDAWTLQYDESIYVVEGHLDLRVVAEDGAETTLAGQPGDIVALPKGVTVKYGAAVGTKLILSIAPVNWRNEEGQ